MMKLEDIIATTFEDREIHLYHICIRGNDNPKQLAQTGLVKGTITATLGKAKCIYCKKIINIPYNNLLMMFQMMLFKNPEYRYWPNFKIT